MNIGQFQLLQTIIVLISLLGIKILLRSIIARLFKSLHMAAERKRIITKIINLFIIILGIVVLTAIWGVNPQQLTIFITSALTVLGVAFFAQWSILSNITSSLILFFNHPIRIGGKIKILDKEYPITGTVENISIFFLYIRTLEGELVTIPNTIVLQKTISVETDGSRI